MATMRKREAKGRRPHFFENPDVDKLLAINLALLSEISVLRDRLDVHERLAETQTWATKSAIDAHEISEEEEDERAADRAQMIDRVLRVIKSQSSDDIAKAEAEYSRMIEGFRLD